MSFVLAKFFICVSINIMKIKAKQEISISKDDEKKRNDGENCEHQIMLEWWCFLKLSKANSLNWQMWKANYSIWPHNLCNFIKSCSEAEKHKRANQSGFGSLQILFRKSIFDLVSPVETRSTLYLFHLIHARIKFWSSINIYKKSLESEIIILFFELD